jgi:CDP-paratose 2-epimerase
MKWLITGGAGFIGAQLARHLLAAGETCIVTDNFYRGRAEGASFLDVRFADQVDACFAANPDIDMVAHLAGQVSLVASLSDPRYDFETNALGTFNVLEAMRRFTPGARLIYSSTNKVYGDLSGLRCGETPTRFVLLDYPEGLPESLPLDPQGCYSCSKGAGDQYVRDYHRIYGLKTIALRQSTIYGGDQEATEDQGWVGWFVRMGVEGSPFRISGTGKQVRDLLHVSDLCRCFTAIGGLPAESGAWGQAFNVGGGPDSTSSLLELFAELRSRYGLVLKFSAGPARTADQKVFVSDTTKLRGNFGWKPVISLTKGLADVVVRARSQWARPTVNASVACDLTRPDAIVGFSGEKYENDQCSNALLQ